MKGKLTIDGKEYILVANRKLLVEMEEINPKFLDLVQNKNKNISLGTGIKIYEDLFFAMLKIGQPEITKENAEELFSWLEDEYSLEVISEMLNNMISKVFTQGGKEKKKKAIPFTEIK